MEVSQFSDILLSELTVEQYIVLISCLSGYILGIVVLALCIFWFVKDIFSIIFKFPWKLLVSRCKKEHKEKELYIFEGEPGSGMSLNAILPNQSEKERVADEAGTTKEHTEVNPNK